MFIISGQRETVLHIPTGLMGSQIIGTIGEKIACQCTFKMGNGTTIFVTNSIILFAINVLR